jgi:hypothetical protein
MLIRIPGQVSPFLRVGHGLLLGVWYKIYVLFSV